MRACMLKAYDIAGWPKAVDRGGPGFPPVVSGILPETGVPLPFVPATAGFHLATARQFSDGRLQEPRTCESRRIKVNQGSSRHPGGTLAISRWPARRRRIPRSLTSPSPAGVGDKWAKSAGGFIVKLSPIKVNRAASVQHRYGLDPSESAPVRPGQTFEIFKNRLPLRRPLFLHSSFLIFHSKIGGFKVIQGNSRLIFFLRAMSQSGAVRMDVQNETPRPSSHQLRCRAAARHELSLFREKLVTPPWGALIYSHGLVY